jgi:hypothetical protein
MAQRRWSSDAGLSYRRLVFTMIMHLTQTKIKPKIQSMNSKGEILTAELKAIDLWDRMLTDTQPPSQMEKDASLYRMFRRVQIAVELHRITPRS